MARGTICAATDAAGTAARSSCHVPVFYMDNELGPGYGRQTRPLRFFRYDGIFLTETKNSPSVISRGKTFPDRTAHFEVGKSIVLKISSIPIGIPRVCRLSLFTNFAINSFCLVDSMLFIEANPSFYIRFTLPNLFEAGRNILFSFNFAVNYFFTASLAVRR